MPTVEALLDQALATQEAPDALAREKAEAWCALAELPDPHPYTAQAQEGCQAWGDHANNVANLALLVEPDHDALESYLAAPGLGTSEQLVALDTFLAVYGPLQDHPRVAEAAARRQALVAPPQPPAEQAPVSAGPSPVTKALTVAYTATAAVLVALSIPVTAVGLAVALAGVGVMAFTPVMDTRRDWWSPLMAGFVIMALTSFAVGAFHATLALGLGKGFDAKGWLDYAGLFSFLKRGEDAPPVQHEPRKRLTPRPPPATPAPQE
jgi:hypothetical protein